jgi:DNA-binding winged helix-turn-helix (wHTH) protein
MAGPAPVIPDRDAHPLGHRGLQERAVLSVLVENHGRVIGRRELSRLAGLAELSERRCDSVLVGIRKVLGADSIITVRSRGWRLADDVVDDARRMIDGDD